MALDISSFKDNLYNDLTSGQALTHDQLNGLRQFVEVLGNRLDQYVKTGEVTVNHNLPSGTETVNVE